MERRGIEIKVGIFVLIAIVAAAAMILKFGKSGRVAGDSFHVIARFDEVGGIIRGASAFYQGVYVGSVADISLDEESSKVLIKLSLFNGTRIPENSRFEIRQVGLLGDKIVSILPERPASKNILAAGAVVEGVVPSDIGNLAERAGSLVHQIGGFVETLDKVIKRIDKELLTPDTMTNVRTTLANTANVTSEATAALKEIKELLKTNRAAVDAALASFAAMGKELETASKRADSLLEENSPKVNKIVSNFEKSSDDLNKITESLKTTAAHIDSLVEKIEKGEGTVGLLLSDEKTRDELKATLENLSAFSENVRKRGILWYKDVSTKPAPAPRPSSSGSRTSSEPSVREGNRGIIYTKPPRNP